MKKILSILLVCIIVCLMPLTVLAEGNDNTDRDEIIAMACAIFPEYASAIQGENIATFELNRSAASTEVVLQETRQYSENCDITYAQFADGAALIAVSDYTENITTTDRVTNSTLNVSFTCDISLTYTYSDEVFRAKGVKFTVDWQAYDSIQNIGDYSSSTTYSAAVYSSDIKYNEDASGDAYVKYKIAFTSSAHATPVDVTYKLIIGDDTRRTEIL